MREIISKVQTMRKEAGFEVMDRIILFEKDNDVIRDVLEKHREEIASEVLANDIILDSAEGYTKTWSINGEVAELGVKKA